MKRFAVFGCGYNQNVPLCYVFADCLEQAWALARSVLEGRVSVSNIAEVYSA